MKRPRELATKGGNPPMTARTEIRVRQIRRRTRQYRLRYETRVLRCLTALSLFLLAGIGALLSSVHRPGISAVSNGYGSVLLRDGAGLYVLIGVAAFAAGAALSVLCIRCRRNANHGNKRTDKEESEEDQ